MTEQRLFDDGELLRHDAVDRSSKEVTEGSLNYQTQVRRSVLWAAYGDALGWISELVDGKGLNRRTLGKPLRQPVGWRRRIGGPGGVTVDLPIGCYSDDTQLRLATARCIRPDGFDIEAFSKVELPVWPSYALGGGKGTTAAAGNLTKPRVQWFANTFKGWIHSGGNGAAMRIQPHVWAASDPSEPDRFLLDVLRNALCTHSHPHGLMGAVLHSLTLSGAMSGSRYLSTEELFAAADISAKIPELIDRDIEMGQYWKTNFQREAGDFTDAWKNTMDECRTAIKAITEIPRGEGQEGYEAVVDCLQLRDTRKRGSGMLTALAAVSLTWCESHPEKALRIAANAIGTDTDTIATMAGAILGANAVSDPPVDVLDREYLISEANRLAAIRQGEKPRSHQYPDLLLWSAPKTQSDVLFAPEEGECWVDGLGQGDPIEPAIPSRDPEFLWQWVRLQFGQTVLIKRRRILPTRVRPMSILSNNLRETLGVQDRSLDEGNTDQIAPESSDAPPDGPFHIQLEGNETRVISPAELDAMVTHLWRHREDDRIVGQAIRRVVNKCSPGQTGAFLAEVIECLRESFPSTRARAE